MNNLTERLFEILENEIPDIRKTEKDETTNFKDMEIDSLDIYSYISTVEEMMAIKIEDEELEQIKCIKDLKILCENKGD